MPRAIACNVMESAMAEKWEDDLADVIFTLCSENADSQGWVRVEEVEPEMSKRGYRLSKDELTDAMGVVAASNNWQIETLDGGAGIRVRAF
jgi:hypothetical protein